MKSSMRCGLGLAISLSLAGAIGSGMALRTSPGHAQATGPSKPFLAVLCTYAGKADTFGITPAYVEEMFTGGTSNISGYMSEVSGGKLDFVGTKAVGWFPLPLPNASYGVTSDGAQRLATDCIGAAMAGGVDVSGFGHFAVFVNDSLDGAAGMAFTPNLTINGATRRYPTVYLGKSGLNGPSLVIHELGHAFGGQHTSNLSDPLGSAHSGDSAEAPNWGLPLKRGGVGPGYGGANRDLLGFIPAERKVAYAGGTQSFDLTRLTQPGAGPTLLNVPIGTGMSRYVVSVRTRTGYDAGEYIPGLFDRFGNILRAQGVQIERLDPPFTFDTVFTSQTSSSDPTTGQFFTPGQTFTDAANSINITVNSLDGNGARVTVSNVTPAPVTPVMGTNPTTPVMPAPPAVPSPLSDNLADAMNVTVPGTVTLDNRGATLEPNEPRCFSLNKSVWVKFTAPATATYTISTDGSNFSAIVAAFRTGPTGTGFAALVPTAPQSCNDDDPAVMTVSATAGEVITVQVGAFANTIGDPKISIR